MRPGVNVHQMLESCWNCRLCPGSGYQIPPILYAGNFGAPILVVAQNPGEIDWEKYPTRREWAQENAQNEDLPGEKIKAFYDYDFGSSYGCTVLGRVFGKGWISTGSFCYTNAVRCRTRKNEAPSEEMVENCQIWTRRLLAGRELVVIVGAIARKQVLGSLSRELDYGDFKRIKNGPVVLLIKHYGAWRTGGEQKVYEVQFRGALKKARLTL